MESSSGLALRLADARDRPAIRNLIVEMQDFERSLDPRLLAGEAIADPYLESLLERCGRYAGAMMVAEFHGDVVGFLAVQTSVQDTELDQAPGTYALISDLVVTPTFRGQGIGRGLIGAAEEFAISAGASEIRIAVLQANTVAMDLYRSCGFQPYLVTLVKRGGSAEVESRVVGSPEM